MIEEIFKTIVDDTDSRFSREVLENCQYVDWRIDYIDFKFKGKDYRLKLTEIPGKNWR